MSETLEVPSLRARRLQAFGGVSEGFVMSSVTSAKNAQRERWAAALLHPAVSKAIALLQAEPGRAWTVKSLAKAVAVSRSVLARRFVEATGSSPLRFLARQRMSWAAHLLESTDWPLAEVGAAVGYESEFAFGKAFRRARGVAPGVYRRAQRSFAAKPLCLAA